jgi:hypothetical protein
MLIARWAIASSTAVPPPIERELRGRHAHESRVLEKPGALLCREAVEQAAWI